jgi:phosphopantothenoylcysteine decarboxylase/phosphopantothenate--cysteine ligase
MARILITCGPTREPIDPVRYISNASSGRTGIAIAREAIERGHEVDLVLGPVEVPPPAGARVIAVTTCAEMLAACLRIHPACDAVIGAAAVADFRPAAPQSGKRRRDGGAWSLALVPNPDILRELARGKGSRVHVGFALQCEDDPATALDRAREKLAEKDLDWIVLNGPIALGGEVGSYALIGRSEPPRDLGRLSKGALAAVLFDTVEKSLKEREPSDR